MFVPDKIFSTNPYTDWAQKIGKEIKNKSQQLSDTGGKGSSAHSHFREEANSENQKRV